MTARFHVNSLSPAVRDRCRFLLRGAAPEKMIRVRRPFLRMCAMGERRSLFDEKFLLLMLGVLMAMAVLRVLRWALHLLGR
jgi:hypothetical protein